MAEHQVHAVWLFLVCFQVRMDAGFLLGNTAKETYLFGSPCCALSDDGHWPEGWLQHHP
jgi:hypothetical protein